MLRSPSPGAALLVGIGLILIVATLPPVRAMTVLVGTVAAFSLNECFRSRLGALTKILVPFALLTSAVAFGRIAGGADIELTIEEHLGRFSFLASVISAAMLFAAFIRPWDALAIADGCKLPRGLGYILVSLYPLSSRVRELGKRQLALLDLKGVERRSFPGRVLTYRRLISPIFSTTLSQQMIHARSLFQRGFFERLAITRFPRFTPDDASWCGILLAMLILSLLVFR